MVQRTSEDLRWLMTPAHTTETIYSSLTVQAGIKKDFLDFLQPFVKIQCVKFFLKNFIINAEQKLSFAAWLLQLAGLITTGQNALVGRIWAKNTRGEGFSLPLAAFLRTEVQPLLHHSLHQYQASRHSQLVPLSTSSAVYQVNRKNMPSYTSSVLFLSKCHYRRFSLLKFSISLSEEENFQMCLRRLWSTWSFLWN